MRKRINVLVSMVSGNSQHQYLHTGRGAEVPQVLAGAVNAEILVLLQAGVPLPSQTFALLLSLSFPCLAFCFVSLQDGRRILGFA